VLDVLSHICQKKLVITVVLQNRDHFKNYVFGSAGY